MDWGTGGDWWCRSTSTSCMVFWKLHGQIEVQIDLAVNGNGNLTRTSGRCGSRGHRRPTDWWWEGVGGSGRNRIVVGAIGEFFAGGAEEAEKVRQKGKPCGHTSCSSGVD